MKYLRIYAGTDGESHFEDVEVALTATAVYPGIPPLGLSTPQSAARVIFARVPAELRDAGWHTARQRQFVVYLAGETEQQASDGEIRRVGPGDVVLAEDTTGKGHLIESGERAPRHQLAAAGLSHREIAHYLSITARQLKDISPTHMGSSPSPPASNFPTCLPPGASTAPASATPSTQRNDLGA